MKKMNKISKECQIITKDGKYWAESGMAEREWVDNMCDAIVWNDRLDCVGKV